MSGADGEGGGRRAQILLVNACHYPGLELPALRRWLAALLAEVAPDADSFAVRLTSDRELARLNRSFRGRDRSTDVLSFPGEATPDGRHLGDVAIAVPTARRQAAAAGQRPGRELRRLLIHGVLHCLGHDHETDGGVMDRRERRLRNRWLRR